MTIIIVKNWLHPPRLQYSSPFLYACWITLLRCTFWGVSIRKPSWVGAVVIYLVFTIHILQFLLPLLIQLLVKLTAITRTLATNPRSIVWDTSVGGVVLEECCEWRLWPVSFDASTLRCPILSIPYAGIHPHRLIEWEGSIIPHLILHPLDWFAIDKYSVSVYPDNRQIV